MALSEVHANWRLAHEETAKLAVVSIRASRDLSVSSLLSEATAAYGLSGLDFHKKCPVVIDGQARGTLRGRSAVLTALFAHRTGGGGATGWRARAASLQRSALPTNTHQEKHPTTYDNAETLPGAAVSTIAHSLTFCLLLVRAHPRQLSAAVEAPPRTLQVATVLCTSAKQARQRVGGRSGTRFLGQPPAAQRSTAPHPAGVREMETQLIAWDDFLLWRNSPK